MNLTNQLLIATPEMADERFFKAVILICEHNEHGALGININMPSDITFEEILESLAIPMNSHKAESIIYEGGPVNTQCGFILHQNLYDYDSSIQIAKNISLTTSKDIIKAIAQDTMNGDWLMALGCATWHEGQLEQEIADNAWLTCASDEKLIFKNTLEKHDKWEQALDIIGVKPHQLSGDIGHA
ncbi:YqgE/AlgH family protein [Marinicella litoralis]|uniref:UPF0301 protein C8D91_2086 n=1 Tax=Marinicella litoralis TaxID=644220 RepID=A0A4R6XN29_9GAMM|nr:YqgE/AlgH family protein [Marinicella litoralis]TDR19530.1 transcriptional regulator [Marinicella litoralis]